VVFAVSDGHSPRRAILTLVKEGAQLAAGAGTKFRHRLLHVVRSQEDAGGHHPVRLVVFDKLLRCAVGADENSSQEMGVVVSNIDFIRKHISASSGMHRDDRAPQR
jgi:hypothetical protein